MSERNEAKYRVKKLEVRDFKRVNVVVMECDDHWNVIGGRNAQGKSSVLDAIEGAMRGKRAMPSEPVRSGADRCEIVADLGDIIVKRVTTAKTDRLVVTNAEGFERKRPQELLDALWGGVAVDPLEFQHLAPAKQAERMLDILGLDFSKADAERKQIFEERTIINRLAKDAKAVADAKPVYADAPESPVSIAELNAKIRETRLSNERQVRAIEARNDLIAEIAHIEEEIVILTKRLEEKREWLKDYPVPDAPVDTADLEKQIEQAEGINAKVRANAEAAEAKKRAEAYAVKSAELTARIEAIDKAKAEQIAAAKFPVEGLAFDEGGLTLNGHPFAQASSAEKWRVSIAVAIAQKPQFAVLLIRDGEKLDADARKAVREMAEAHDCQIFVEDCRATDEEATVVIEDGRNI